MDLAFLSDVAGALPSPTAGGLAVAFLLGLIHAVDADHVMALSVFATRERGAAAGARAGLRWSLGHGAVLLVVGLVFVGLGLALPATWTAIAERAVGIVMIGLGAWVWIELARRRAHLHFHAHDGLRPHAHWHAHRHAHPAARAPRHQHEHGALFVGALHGLAGSAPLLVVLPIAASAPAAAAAYLVLFGLGVAVAMVAVSGALGHVAGRLAERRAERGLSWLRGLGAFGSVAIGAWLAFPG
ncbi:MAG: urease accessory protein [Myxococcota bacterium]